MAAVAAVAAAVIVLPIAAGLLRLVVAGVDSAPDSTPADTSTTAPTTPPAATSVAAPRALGPVVHMAQGAEHAVGGLEPDTALQVRVSGFFAFAEARVRQCVGADSTRCGNDAPVQFGGDGSASFQYLVALPSGPRSCRVIGDPCSIVVEEVDGDQRATLRTVFHDPLPPEARIRVEPASKLNDGQTVRVSVEGLPPFARADVVLCSLPFDRAGDRCGAPGVVVPIRADAQGDAAADYTVRDGPVGRARVPCGRGSNCGLVVLSDEAVVRAQPVALVFAKPAGAQYSGMRLAIGLALALLLVAIATWLVMRTDWAPVGEEAAPEIDEAEYADLDGLVAAMPPEALEPSL